MSAVRDRRPPVGLVSARPSASRRPAAQPRACDWPAGRLVRPFRARIRLESTATGGLRDTPGSWAEGRDLVRRPAAQHSPHAYWGQTRHLGLSSRTTLTPGVLGTNRAQWSPEGPAEPNGAPRARPRAMEPRGPAAPNGAPRGRPSPMEPRGPGRAQWSPGGRPRPMEPRGVRPSRNVPRPDRMGA